jgi:beta-lactamase class C
MATRGGARSSRDLRSYIQQAVGGFKVQPSAFVVALHYNGTDYVIPVPDTLDEGTVFGVGSVTKVFTATLLAYQCTVTPPQKALTDAVTAYLPGSVGSSALKQVTLQQLATHTSSLPPEGGGPTASDNLFADQPPSGLLEGFWKKWQPPQAPGSCWCYSDVGFITLGFAVSGVGSPPASFDYLTLLSDVITGPSQLNMPATTTYANQKPGIVTPGYEPDGKPATGHAADLYSSGPDMLTWLKANLYAASGSTALDQALAFAQQNQNVTHEICTACQSPGVTQTTFSMGLAWQIGSRTPQIWGKDGATGLGGYSCWIGFAPSAEIALAILTNRDGADPGLVGVPMIQELARW